jgi:2,4-dienoyl-CoA reductase-like NADH-dependent reductase (Old Yellow Enzyme family)
MNNFMKQSTRRTFIKGVAGSIALTTTGVTGFYNIGYPLFNYRSKYKLFSEGQIGSLKLKNRLIRAATLERASLNGYPTDDYLNMLTRQVEGGVSLVITGAMAPDPTGLETQIFVYDDHYIPALEKIVKVVRNVDNSCKVMAQVVKFNEESWPSGINWEGDQSLGIMTVERINTIINNLSESIRRIRDAGFDGAELNAHYVYLLSSFLSPHTNKRTDVYGGTLEKRIRIVREIMDQARLKVGPDFPIMIKLNCEDSFSPAFTSDDGTNLSNFHLLAAEIENAGFDAIEISGNTVLREGIITYEEESYFSPYTENLNLHIPVILTGGNRSIDHMEKILKNGKVEFFGLARPFIREPDLAKRWQEKGSTVKCKCISCNNCLYASGPLRCMQENS